VKMLIVTALATLLCATPAIAQVAHPTDPDGPEARVQSLTYILVHQYKLSPRRARLHAEAAAYACAASTEFLLDLASRFTSRFK